MQSLRQIIRAGIKVVAGLAVVAMLAYLGACVYGNFIAKPKGTVTLPPAARAVYLLTVKNTGTVVLSSKVEQTGPDAPGQRTYRLPDGYWEVARGGKFKFIKFDLTMDEKIWGEISVSRRTQ